MTIELRGNEFHAVQGTDTLGPLSFPGMDHMRITAGQWHLKDDTRVLTSFALSASRIYTEIPATTGRIEVPNEQEPPVMEMWISRRGSANPTVTTLDGYTFCITDPRDTLHIRPQSSTGEMTIVLTNDEGDEHSVIVRWDQASEFPNVITLDTDINSPSARVNIHYFCLLHQPTSLPIYRFISKIPTLPRNNLLIH